MTKIFKKADNEQILMARLSDFAYYNFYALKCGNPIFKDKSLDNWYFYQLSEITESIKHSVFSVINDEEKKIIIVFKGSEPSIFDVQKFISDWCISDLRMLIGQLPLSFFDYLQYVAQVKSDFKDYKLYMTGHSLGGSIAQLIASVSYNYDIKTYTFNAFGAKHLLKCLEKENLEISNSQKNITNFIVNTDLIAKKNNHIGLVYQIKYKKTLLNSFISILKELPKIFVNLPYKITNSLKYYFKSADFILKKIDSHLMNNFTNSFEYEILEKNKKE